MTGAMHKRVEFTADLGSGPIVAAFVDFSSQGISFGVPYNVQIRKGTPEDPSPDLAIREYQRVTVHTDGNVETHLPTPIPVPELEEFDQDMAPLAQWGDPFYRRFELVWASDHIAFMQGWLAKPKPSTHSTCLKVEVCFNHSAVSTVVNICVLNPGMDVNDVVPTIRCDVQSWFLTGGWPWVLVQMSNMECPGTDQLATVGRDYRQCSVS